MPKINTQKLQQVITHSFFCCSNFYDLLFADICEDPEIRERILHLKSEQESKRAQEQQRRRGVRRSQSNNTRTQNVRRTSIRDKGLTSKKEAVAEARLRIQARDVIIFFQVKIKSLHLIIVN
jgi:hypothetical protein